MAEPIHPAHLDAEGNALCTFDLRVTATLKDDWLAARGYETGYSAHGSGSLHLPRRPDAKKRDAVVLDALDKGLVTFPLYKEGARATTWESDRVVVPIEAIVRVSDAGFHRALDADVLAHFFAGTPADKCARLFRQNRTASARGTYMGFALRREGPMADRGTMRLWYDADGRLFSYDMPLGLWVVDARGQRLFLVNGDGAPTPTTALHQREMRKYLEDVRYEDDSRGERSLVVDALRPHAIVPFSVLRSANIDFDNLTILDATPARVWRREEPCRRKSCDTPGAHTHIHESHFLGEALLRDARGRIFLSGLDRNDAANKRSFYICQVSRAGDKKKPMSVEAAIAALRPEDVPANTPRQGEWFFVPEPDYKPAGDVFRANRLPIVSDNAKEQLRNVQKYESHEGVPHGAPPRLIYRIPDHDGRHVATTVVVNGAVYAKGRVHDREHSTLVLGDTFHRVVKNRAIEGWRYDPVAMRARVD